NVSFYSERGQARGATPPSDSPGGNAILPTPIVGVVGVLDDAGRLATQWFKAAGHRIALLGPDAVSLGGSEYLWTLHERLAGRLAPLDLETERRVQAAVRAAVGGGVVAAAPDCAGGGRAPTLAAGGRAGPRGGGVGGRRAAAGGG